MLPEVTNFSRLILLRHPELAPDDAGRAIGSGAARLGRRGQDMVLRWLALFGPFAIDLIAASDQPQCADAAAALAAAKGLDVTTDERLRDQFLGEWQGIPWQEVAAREPDRLRDFFEEFGEVAAPGGESLGQAVERFLAWWTELCPAVLGKTVVVVTSGAMLTGFAAALLGMRLSRAVCLNLPHGGAGILDRYENGVRVSCWNPDALRVDD